MKLVYSYPCLQEPWASLYVSVSGTPVITNIEFTVLSAVRFTVIALNESLNFILPRWHLCCKAYAAWDCHTASLDPIRSRYVAEIVEIIALTEVRQ